MPRSSSSWEGAEALWITAAGWAAAAEKILGNAMVVTSDRIAQPKEVWNYPLLSKNNKPARKRFPFVPAFFRTILSDLLTWRSLKNWKILDTINNDKGNISFVWEKHDLFSGPGRRLADRLNVPLISYVHAPVVWEASKWGVKRYIWGKWLEKIEASNLKKANYVAVVSEEVKQKVLEMGVSENKIFISPMAVEPDLFSGKDSSSWNNDDLLDIKDKFVIGWTGSFRKFHGLDHVIKAFREISEKYPNAVLMLVGDGSEREASETLTTKLKIRDKVIFTGRKQFLEIPNYVCAFDMAVVSAREATGFHYSPLKLREYMAAGKAVLAPDAGEIPYTFKDEVHLKLFRAGDIESLRRGMEFFICNEYKRREIAGNGKELALKTSTWKGEVEKCLRLINYTE